jgi:CheY-like chemotaxis protein
MLRVLVVDDNQDTLTTFAILLPLYGHHVDVAPDGPSALAMIPIKQPAVVLLDLGLPKMDGWQVAKQIRQHCSGQRRPLIIAVSGYGTQADRLRSYDAGIDLHLVKPVDPEQLETLLKRYRETIASVYPHAKALLPAPVGTGDLDKPERHRP